jgi:hypothetical protein
MGLRLFFCSFVLVSVTQAEDLLPSWADTAPKQAILDFVAKVSNPNGKDFVPEQDRLAVFDNDGTLWPECPMPFQIAFVVDEVKRLATEQPELAKDPMIKAALEGDFKALFAGEKHDGFMKIMALTHSGMTSDEFSSVSNHGLQQQNIRHSAPRMEKQRICLCRKCLVFFVRRAFTLPLYLVVASTL